MSRRYIRPHRPSPEPFHKSAGEALLIVGILLGSILIVLLVLFLIWYINFRYTCSMGVCD